jgi:hypothetical protein
MSVRPTSFFFFQKARTHGRHSQNTPAGGPKPPTGRFIVPKLAEKSGRWPSLAPRQRRRACLNEPNRGSPADEAALHGTHQGCFGVAGSGGSVRTPEAAQPTKPGGCRLPLRSESPPATGHRPPAESMRLQRPPSTVDSSRAHVCLRLRPCLCVSCVFCRERPRRKRKSPRGKRPFSDSSSACSSVFILYSSDLLSLLSFSRSHQTTRFGPFGSPSWPWPHMWGRTFHGSANEGRHLF